MADRVRVASSRKRTRGGRPAKKKTMRRRLGVFGLAVLAAMILGFLTKRIMIPSAVHYIAYRPPAQPPNPPAAANGQGDTGSSEDLTPGDRSELDAIIKRKAK